MKMRILLGAVLVAAVAVGARANSGYRQWTIVNFIDPVQVKGELIMGPVLIVHDDLKMSNGQPCTTFYRFDRAKGPQEELVSFHCRPAQRATAGSTLLTIRSDATCRRLLEYQIAGDSEGHGVPDK